MQKVKKTYEILVWRLYGRAIDQEWADWACDMMLAGYDTEHLPQLSIIEKPYNHFELAAIADKILNELGLGNKSKEEILENYVTSVAHDVLDDRMDKREALHFLKHLYVEDDYLEILYDFYLFYYALEEYEGMGVQFYVPDVKDKNLEQESLNLFKKWIEDHPHTF